MCFAYHQTNHSRPLIDGRICRDALPNRMAAKTREMIISHANSRIREYLKNDIINKLGIKMCAIFKEAHPEVHRSRETYRQLYKLSLNQYDQ